MSRSRGKRKHKRAVKAGRVVRKHIRERIAKDGLRPLGMESGLRGIRKKVNEK